jgi:SPP1 gp7 family putative phage head morphogenesis protein
VTTTTSAPDPDPYAVELLLAAALQQISDQQDAQITHAWAQAWGSVSAELLDTLAVILADVGRVNATAVVRYQRLASVLGAIADHLDEITQHAGIVITNDLHEVVQRAEVGTRELIVAQKLLRDERQALPVRRVPSPAMRAIVQRTTEQVTSQLQPLADETYTTILRELTKGTAAGDNPRETARRMVARSEDLHNFGRSRALNIARTETLDAYRAGAQETEQQYTDVLAGWVWSAHLSTRTCRSCLAMNGRVFDLDVPGPDDHPQGRCARVPVVREADGSVDTSWLPDAEQHFESLSPADQEAILGKAGYAAWKRGEFPIDQWTKTRSAAGWRDSQVPASPGDPDAGRTGSASPTDGGGTTPPKPPTGPGTGGPDDPFDAKAHLAGLNVALTDANTTHILDGDHDGGGHRHGTIPSEPARKTWFPQGWSDEKILEAVNAVIADPIVARWNSNHAFFNAYGEVDGVRIKVRISPDGRVRTAHPIDGSGVEQIQVKTDGTSVIKQIPYGRSREVSW